MLFDYGLLKTSLARQSTCVCLPTREAKCVSAAALAVHKVICNSSSVSHFSFCLCPVTSAKQACSTICVEVEPQRSAFRWSRPKKGVPYAMTPTYFVLAFDNCNEFGVSLLYITLLKVAW